MNSTDTPSVRVFLDGQELENAKLLPKDDGEFFNGALWGKDAVLVNGVVCHQLTTALFGLRVGYGKESDYKEISGLFRRGEWGCEGNEIHYSVWDRLI